MAIEGNQTLLHSFEAAADLSAKQYYFVKLTSAGKVDVCAAVTDVPIGVLQNKPVAGQAATVLIIGISKVIADVALDEGNIIGTAADGQAQVVTVGTETTVYIAGQCIYPAANAGEVASAVINCAAPSRAS
jgi:hypothetical protein